MDEIAYTTILDGPKFIDGKAHHYRLVCADASGGFRTLKETGDAADPFYVAKGPIWFTSRADGEVEADRRNVEELHLDRLEAGKIIIRSMATSMRAS